MSSTAIDHNTIHALRIATPTMLGKFLIEGDELEQPNYWGSNETYHVDPWLRDVEQVVLTEFMDKSRDSFVMVNTPPQIGKTTFSGEFLLFWILGMFPDTRIIFISYSDDYSRQKGQKVRDLVEKYGYLFGISVNPNNASASDWTLAGHRGGMLAAGIGSQVTGRSGDLIVIDDVIKEMTEARSPTIKQTHIDNYDAVIRTRLQPGGLILITATRWVDDDISGQLQERMKAPDYEGDDWQVLSYPAIAEPPSDVSDELDEVDEAGDVVDNVVDLAEWRDRLGRRVGEPLATRYGHPDPEAPDTWRDNHFYRVRRSGMDAFIFSCLFQQNPSADEDGMFPKSRWQFYDELPELIATRRVWDMASTDGGGDFTVGTKLGRTADGDWYIIDVERFQRGPDRVRRAVIDCAIVDGFRTPIRIEQERSGMGKTVIEFYQSDVELLGYDIQPVKADGSKESRATPYSAMQKAGKVWLKRGAPWVKAFIAEHARMMGDGRRPKHDDQIDTAAYGVSDMMGLGPVQIFDTSEMTPDGLAQMIELAERLGYEIAA